MAPMSTNIHLAEITKILDGLDEESVLLLSGLTANSAADVARLFPDRLVVCVGEARLQPADDAWQEDPGMSLFARLLQIQIANGLQAPANLWVMTDLGVRSSSPDPQVITVGSLPARIDLCGLRTTKGLCRTLSDARFLGLTVAQGDESLAESIERDIDELRVLRAEITKLGLAEDRLFLSGVASISGLPTINYGSQVTKLQLSSAEETIAWPLGQARVSALRLFPQMPTTYDFSGFGTLRNSGIDLSALPLGEFTIQISVLHSATPRSGDLLMAASGVIESGISVQGSRIYELKSSAEGRRAVVQISSVDPSPVHPKWRGRLRNNDGVLSMRTPRSLDGKSVILSVLPENGYSMKSYLGVLANKQVTFTPPVGEVPSGRSKLLLTVVGDTIQTYGLGQSIKVTQPGGQPQLAVLGSNVTHDNFESQVHPSGEAHFNVVARVNVVGALSSSPALMRDSYPLMDVGGFQNYGT